MIHKDSQDYILNFTPLINRTEPTLQWLPNKDNKHKSEVY